MDQTAVIFIIIGVTGDLARTKLLPAITELVQGGALPNGFRIIGTSRRSDINVATLLKDTPEASLIESSIELFSAEFNEVTDAERLLARLDEIDKEYESPPVRIFHLSVPPAAAQHIISSLADTECFKDERSRLLLEKPLGTDAESAEKLEEFLAKHVDSAQLYRIDHYLQKRLTHVLSKGVLQLPELSSGTLTRIDVIASESKDIGTRAKFYDTVGALRDVLQNHLLELAATLLILENSTDIPSARLEALKTLTADPASAVRAQYEGYAQATSMSSQTETFVGVTLLSTDSRIQNVPIRLMTGKALADKRTEIRLVTSEGTTSISFDTIKIIRDGVGHIVESLPEFDGYAAAYYAAITTDHQFFVSKDESLEAWRIVGPVLESWKKGAQLKHYPPGTDIDSLYP
jgi:glucose-6-phosphate 1-dehydrogenase